MPEKTRKPEYERKDQMVNVRVTELSRRDLYLMAMLKRPRTAASWCEADGLWLIWAEAIVRAGIKPGTGEARCGCRAVEQEGSPRFYVEYCEKHY